MTTTDTSGDLASIARLKATNERLREKLDVLEMDYEDLQGELAAKPDLSPYDMPAEVAEVLIKQLAGWPAKRWRDLAALIEAYVVRSMPMPDAQRPTSSSAESARDVVPD